MLLLLLLQHLLKLMRLLLLLLLLVIIHLEWKGHSIHGTIMGGVRATLSVKPICLTAHAVVQLRVRGWRCELPLLMRIV